MTIHSDLAARLPAALDRFPVADPARIARLNALLDEVRRAARLDAEQERYGAAAAAVEDALCCPVEYDPRDLAHIPRRILDVDYGCGDPTAFAGEGMTVLDLGSGSGKHAFMVAKKVGPSGRVIGIDKTAPMLALAREAVGEVMAALGHAVPNVEFRRGRIENLAIDHDRLAAWLDGHPLDSYDALERLEEHLAAGPLIAGESVDLVVSNCVLNLVEDGRKDRLLAEVFRVLRRGGSVAISDIVADREVPDALKRDQDLWTGCLSGAWPRDRFLDAFARAGFYGMTEVKSAFWKRVAGINFFSVTVRAWKGKQGPCFETWRSAMYRGPFSSVCDDDHHVYPRGRFVPVCDKTAEILAREPYASFFHVSPRLADPAAQIPFDCGGGTAERTLTSEQQRMLDGLIDQGACCAGDGCC